MMTIAEPYSRYLRLLGFDREPSGLEGLQAIVCRHLCRVPFENVSKLLLFAREGAGRTTTLSEFLDGIEHQDLGGTCYTSNPFLAELLSALGYEAELLGADMRTPNIHTSIRVRIGPAEYHVDVGYAAPFRKAMRLDQLPHEFPLGSYRYVLDRNRRGGIEVTVYSDRERLHGYAVHGPSRSPDFFTETILESYRPGKTFMSCLRITRFFEEHAVELRNNTLIRYRGRESGQTRVNSMAELRSAVANEFAMPRCPIEEAVDVLQQVTGKQFFGGEIWAFEP